MSLEPLGAHYKLRCEVRVLRAALEAMKAGVEIEKAAHAACCENRLEILADLARVRGALEKAHGMMAGAMWKDGQIHVCDDSCFIRAALKGQG